MMVVVVVGNASMDRHIVLGFLSVAVIAGRVERLSRAPARLAMLHCKLGDDLVVVGLTTDCPKH